MNEDIKTFLLETYGKAKALLECQTRETLAHKSANDLLSRADLALNGFFVSEIKAHFPEARIIAEESENLALSEEFTFVVDPLDGTCNFARGIPLYGIQVAVFEKGECTSSLVGLPCFDRLYYAEKGKGAYRNGERLFLNRDLPASDGVLELSDFYRDEKDIGLEEQFALVAELQGRFLKTRLFGAACIDFTAIAESHAQCYICYYRHIWDIAPGLLVAKEAGAVESRLNGEPYRYGDQSLVLANNEETLDLVLKAAEKHLR